MKPNTQSRLGRRSLSLKIISFLVLTTFSTLQISWAYEPTLSGTPLPENYLSEKNPEEEDTPPALVESPLYSTSLDFLGEDQPLSAVTESEPEIKDYEYERYEFEEALDLLRPEYASAAVIEGLEAENLKALSELSFEVGIAILHGELVLFSSGHDGEILVTKPVNEILKQSTFTVHTHPLDHEAAGPSPLDLAHAGDRLEYVVSGDQVWAYNHEGMLQELSYSEFLRALSEVLEVERKVHGRDLVKARGLLNFFIQEMDRLNEEVQHLKIETFRTAGTVTPDSTLTSANLTSFSGSPWVLLMAGSSTATTAVQQSSSQFQIQYDVTQSGSKSGAYVSFDNPTTTAVELRDLAVLTDLIVGVSGPSGSKVKFEVEDSLGAKSDVTLINLSTTMQYYKISKTLFTGIDWMKIKRFIYSIDSTLTSQLTGTLTIQTKTLLYSTTQLTNLPNYPYVALAANSSTATTLVETGSTGFKLNYNISQAGSISGGGLVLDNPSTTTVEYGNLSTQTQFTFGIAGPTGGKVKLEFEDQVGAKSSAVLTGLTSTTQFYTVDKNRFTGLDWTKMKRINFIVDQTLGNPTTGTITIVTRTLTYSTTLLTDTGSAAKVEIAPGSTSGTVARIVSANLATASFVLSGTGTKSGMAITFDDPQTASTVETKDFSTLSQFVFSAYGISNGKIRVELEDINGAKASTILSGLSSSTPYYYSVSASAFSGVDRSRIRRIIFSVDPTLTSLTSGTFTVGVKTLYFDTGLLTRLPSAPNVVVTSGSSTATTVVKEAAAMAQLNFNVTTAGTYSGASLSFDDPTTTATVETKDLSQNTTFTFGLQSSNSSYVTKVKLEVQDVSGAKASYVISGIGTNVQYFTVQRSRFTGIDWTKVKCFNFIMDQTLVSSSTYYSSWMNIMFDAPEASFQESQGLLVVDAEHAYQNLWRSSKTWEFKTSTAGYAGDGYFFGGQDTGSNFTGTSSKAGPELRYKVNIQTPGTYYVWVRGYSPNTSGDSIHVGIDGMLPSSSDNFNSFTIGSYSWSKTTSDSGAIATLNITTAGDHVLNVWMREDGFSFDKIILTKDSAYTPTLTGPQESPRVSTITVNPPTVSALPQYTNQSSITLSGTKPQNTSILINGVEEVPIDSLTSWSKTVTLTVEGANPFSITAKDSQENQSTPVNVSTIRDTLVPTGSININSGAQYANSTSVTLNLSAQDGTGSGIDQMSFSTDNVAYSTPEAYSATKSYTLPTGDGSKTIYVKYYDKAGNVSQVYSK
ncbi:MAG: hypothetical protein HYS55_02190, partial [Candidatus Omnitrophica bacterium]|nr:hypothetical protein [Candidatus Omnitrophota bacterium]